MVLHSSLIHPPLNVNIDQTSCLIDPADSTRPRGLCSTKNYPSFPITSLDPTILQLIQIGPYAYPVGPIINQPLAIPPPLLPQPSFGAPLYPPQAIPYPVHIPVPTPVHVPVPSVPYPSPPSNLPRYGSYLSQPSFALRPPANESPAPLPLVSDSRRSSRLASYNRRDSHDRHTSRDDEERFYRTRTRSGERRHRTPSPEVEYQNDSLGFRDSSRLHAPRAQYPPARRSFDETSNRPLHSVEEHRERYPTGLDHNTEYARPGRSRSHSQPVSR